MLSPRLISRRAAGLFAALALALIAALPLSAIAQPIGPDTVIATVNGDPITGADLALAGAEFTEQLSQVAPDRRDAAVLDLVINMRLASAAAQASGMDKEPLVVTRLDLARDRTLYSEFLRSKFIAAVTEATVRARFDEETAKFVPQEEIKARHILVNNDQEALAKEIIAELDAGGDFAKIAAEKSTDTGSGQSGGDLGWFKRGMMVKPFEDAAFALEPGQYTKTPVKSDFGWHVILVEDKRMEQPPTFEVEGPRIEQELVRETFDKEIGALRAAATIEMVPPPGAAAAPPAEEAPPAAEGTEPPAQ
jgi:peptidyl-prolyl cis-trans isomerase C